jgi:hypothetical protein
MQIDKRITNDWAIDSLKVRLPLSKVKVLNDSLSEMILYVSQSTGDILDEKERKSIPAGEVSKGIKITFSKETQAGQFSNHNIPGERKGSIEYFVMLINAKALEGDYFTGITETTTKKLYDYLMKSEYVYFPYQLMFEFECTDIDFKKDYFQDPSIQQQVLQNLHGRAIASKSHAQGVKNLFKNKIQDTNYFTGIQFNERKTATQKAPFFKIYSKTNDLQTTSSIFAQSCLEGEIPQNLYRNEFTIKDKKHLARYGISNTFEALIELSQEQIEAMYDSIQKLCLEGSYTTNLDIQKKKITPSDLLVLGLLLIPLQRGETYTPIKRQVLSLFNKENRYKKGLILDRVFYKHIAVKGKGKKWRVLDEALNLTGGNFLSNEH